MNKIMKKWIIFLFSLSFAIVLYKHVPVMDWFDYLLSFNIASYLVSFIDNLHWSIQLLVAGPVYVVAYFFAMLALMLFAIIMILPFFFALALLEHYVNRIT